LRPHIRRLAERVWKAEVGGKKPCPYLDRIGMPTLAGEEGFHASFRLALKQLTHFVRDALAGGNRKAAARQLGKSPALDCDVTARCDHCKHKQPVVMGTTEHECRKCGKAFKVEW